MFICVVSQGISYLYKDQVLIFQQPLNPDPDLVRDVLIFKLVKTFFQNSDGEALAELKAIELQDYMLQYLPQGLEFTLEETVLQTFITQALMHLSEHLFDEYCGQQLYIHSLHQIVSHVTFYARDGPGI
jgi:hypothetical protein